jgi:hypothetical protein
MALFDALLIKLALQKRVGDFPPEKLARIVFNVSTINGYPYDPTVFYEVLEAFPPTPTLTWMQYLEAVRGRYCQAPG